MFSNLLRQQARLGLSLRLTTPLRRQSQKSGIALATQKSQILSHRTFCISRTLFQESTEATQAAQEETSSKPTFYRDTRGPTRVLFLANLPFNIEEGEIRELFSSYGEIQRIHLSTDDLGRHIGRGYLEFFNHESATQAVQSNTEEPFVLSDRRLTVQYASSPPREWRPASRTERIVKEIARPFNVLHISNYPAPGDQRPLRELLGDSQDEIRHFNFVKGLDGSPTEKAFVRFANIETAQSFLKELDGRELMGVKLRVYYALGQGRPGRPYRALHIPNYPAPGDERPLRELLGAAEGKVLRINFAKDSEGRLTEKTFVNFADVETATSVLNELSGRELMGVNLTVFYASNRRFRERESPRPEMFDA